MNRFLAYCALTNHNPVNLKSIAPLLHGTVYVLGANLFALQDDRRKLI